MIVYVIAAAALAVFLAVRTHLDDRPATDPAKRARFHRISGIAGALLVLVPFAVGWVLTGRENDSGEWGRDMFLGYYKAFLPAAAVLLLLLLFASLGALSSPKLRTGLFPRFRLWANLAASVLFLLVTPFYAAVTVNRYLPIPTLILCSGIGISLLFRLALLVEYRVRQS
ncbi:MAG: hypothetical protein K6A33_01030 [Clostridiales bacterium]|nr:hypothetical protein [Clostridiales bacterium]